MATAAGAVAPGAAVPAAPGLATGTWAGGAGWQAARDSKSKTEARRSISRSFREQARGLYPGLLPRPRDAQDLVQVLDRALRVLVGHAHEVGHQEDQDQHAGHGLGDRDQVLGQGAGLLGHLG